MDQVTTLQTAGEDARLIADKLEHQIEAMAFSGPAAERFRSEMRGRTLRLRHAAQELQNVAGIIGHGDATS